MFTNLELRFIEAYGLVRNRRKAWRKAGGHSADYQSAVNRPHITSVLNQIDADAIRLSGIDKAWVLRRAALIADFNIQAFLHTDPDTGKPYFDFSEATDDEWYCIQEYSETPVLTKGRIEANNIKLKFEAKMAALRLIAEHTDVDALVPQKVVLSGDDYVAIRKAMLQKDDV